MSISITTTTDAYTKQVNLSSLPSTTIEKQPKGGAIFMILFSLFWGGVPTMALVSSLTSNTAKPEMAFLLIFTIIGALLFLGGIHLLVASTTTVIDSNRVTVSKRSLFGTKQWSEALAAFQGITWRSEYHSGGKNKPSYTLYIVELKHTDPKKAVKLYESRAGGNIRAIWEDHCRKLNLPAVETDGKSIVKRDVADLDKSVKELIEEGKMKVDLNPTKPPPDLAVRADGDFLEVSTLRKKVAPLGLVITLILPIVFMYVGFFVKSASVVFGFVGLVIFVIMVAGAVYSYLSTDQIRIGRDEIRLRKRLPWGVSEGECIKIELIETVRIGNKSDQGGSAVLLETDSGIVEAGKGLSPEAMEWLKNCIMRQIAVQAENRSQGLLDKSRASFNSSNFVSKIGRPVE